MNDNIISCPICSKEFSSAMIESHVSKCLFLNESTSNESAVPFKDESFDRKHIKLSNKKTKQGDSGSTKRKSILMESSFTNTDNQISKTSFENNVIIILNLLKQRMMVLG